MSLNMQLEYQNHKMIMVFAHAILTDKCMFIVREIIVLIVLDSIHEKFQSYVNDIR